MVAVTGTNGKTSVATFTRQIWAALGEAALAQLPAALLALAAERLVAGTTDEPAALVPAYVALPRGVHLGPEDLGWSPDLR